MTRSFTALFAFAAPLALATTAHAQLATTAVKGPVTVEVAGVSADITVVAGGNSEVKVEVAGGDDAVKVELQNNGSRVSATFNGSDSLLTGRVRVTVPKGSTLALVSTSGDIKVYGVGGDCEARSASGDIAMTGCKRTAVNNVSGDVVLGGVSGNVELKTVSGDARIATAVDGLRMRFQSTAGEISWTGRCGKDCRVDANTLSGDVELHLDKASSFDLVFRSLSGDFEDVQGNATAQKKEERGRSSATARYGKGEGKIAVETYSADCKVDIAKK